MMATCQTRTAGSEKHTDAYNDVCPICHGSGWELYRPDPFTYADIYNGHDIAQDFAKKCSRCFGIKKSEDTTTVPDNMREADITKFNFNLYSKGMATNEKIARHFFESYKEWEQNGRGLYIYSKTAGSGKTFLACCLAKSVMMKYGKRMKFITAPDYMDKVAQGYDLAKEGIKQYPAQPYKDCDLLILDDIGAQMSKEWQNQELFKLINYRVTEGLITIYTSNLSLDKLNVDDRIKSRIEASSIYVPMPEESIRQLKASRAQSEFLRRVN